MDVVYRIDDPDDATVKVRALAFVNGIRSFSNVLRPVTFVEGTASNIGDAITTNVNHTLSWNVGADWNISLGNVKFEILARDARGLLPIEWISLPAAVGHDAVTVSKDTPSGSDALNGFFWQYAAGDPNLTLISGVLMGNSNSGGFSECGLVSGAAVQDYGLFYLFRAMNLDLASSSEMDYAAAAAGAVVTNPASRHFANRPYAGISLVLAFGANDMPAWAGCLDVPINLSGVKMIAASAWSGLALKNDGKIVIWGNNGGQDFNPPAGLSGVTSIAAGSFHFLAIKNTGDIVAWGMPGSQINIPSTLAGVVVSAISAGSNHSLALKSAGTLVAWGENSLGQCNIPSGLTGVTAIACGANHSLALKSNGTIVAWGDNTYYGQSTIPAGLTGVTAIACGSVHNLALKSDGTVAAWGDNSSGQCNIPFGLTGVTAIACGANHSLALKSNGTLVAWGSSYSGISNIPSGLHGITAIAGGEQFTLVRKFFAP